MPETNAQPAQPPEQRTRRWKRTAAAALLLLLGSAIVNVAVAWGYVINARPSLVGVSGGRWSQWPVPVPSHWPDVCGHRTAEGIGCRVTRYEAYDIAGPSRTVHTVVFSIERTESGWPLHSLRSEKWGETGHDRLGMSHHYLDGHPKPNVWRTGLEVRVAPDSITLPIRPTFPGFLVNTILYAALLWLLIGSLFAARRTLRRRRGLCGRCAYPVGTSPVCTECGAAIGRRA